MPHAGQCPIYQGVETGEVTALRVSCVGPAAVRVSALSQLCLELPYSVNSYVSYPTTVSCPTLSTVV